MKELLTLYKMVWGSYGGSKAFYRGEIVGVAMAFFLGVTPWWMTLAVGGLFLLLNFGTQIVIAIKKAPEYLDDPEVFEKGRVALMVRTIVSNYLFLGFIVAQMLMYVLVTYLAGGATPAVG